MPSGSRCGGLPGPASGRELGQSGKVRQRFLRGGLVCAVADGDECIIKRGQGCWARSGHGSLSGMTTPSNPCRGFRFPAEVIQHAVWLYHCFSLSPRDAEAAPAACGVVVSYESIREWGLRFGRLFANTLKRRRPRPGDKWHLDEVFIRIRGKMHYLWRAVGQHGHVLDIPLQGRCSAIAQRSPGGMSAKLTGAAKHFFRKLLKGLQHVPRVVVTDRLRSYAAAKREITGVATAA